MLAQDNTTMHNRILGKIIRKLELNFPNNNSNKSKIQTLDQVNIITIKFSPVFKRKVLNLDKVLRVKS